MKLVVRAMAEVYGLGAAALAAILVLRAVGPAIAGELALATTVFYLATVLVNGGLPSASAQEVASRPASVRPVVLTTGVLRLGYAAVFTVVAEVVLLEFPIAESLKQLIAFVIPGVFVLCFKHEWLLVARGAVGAVAASRILSATATLAVAIFLIHDSPGAVPLAVYLLSGPAAAALVTSVLALVHEQRALRHADGTGAWILRPLATKGLHYLRADLSIFVYNNSDRFFLFAFGGPTVVGLYDAAYKLIQPFSAISAVVTDSMYLTLARALGTQHLRDVYGRYVRLMFVGTVPIGFVAAAFGPAIVLAVYGERYEASGGLLAALGWVVTAGYLSGAMVIPFTAWHAPKPYGNTIMAGSIANLILNVLLIPPLLGFGAALATILAKLATVLAAVRPFRVINDYPVFREFAVFALISAVATGMAWVVVHALSVPEILGLPIFALAYGGALVVAHLLSRPSGRLDHDQTVLERGSSL